MSWITGVAIYFVLWWIVLFAVLPFGVETPEEPEPGMASSAPVRPRILAKFLWTTVISTVIFAVGYGLFATGILSFRDLMKP